MPGFFFARLGARREPHESANIAPTARNDRTYQPGLRRMGGLPSGPSVDIDIGEEMKEFVCKRDRLVG